MSELKVRVSVTSAEGVTLGCGMEVLRSRQSRAPSTSKRRC